MSNCITKRKCLVEACIHRVTVHVHVSYHCLFLRMAHPRPSAPPVQTGSHPQAERCVKTWTASAWWSSSCPSSQFHHLGPTALREREATNITINYHWHHLHRLPNHYSCSSAVSYTLPHSHPLYSETTAVQPLLHFSSVSAEVVCGVIIAQIHQDKSNIMRVWTHTDAEKNSSEHIC